MEFVFGGGGGNGGGGSGPTTVAGPHQHLHLHQQASGVIPAGLAAATPGGDPTSSSPQAAALISPSLLVGSIGGGGSPSSSSLHHDLQHLHHNNHADHHHLHHHQPLPHQNHHQHEQHHQHLHHHHYHQHHHDASTATAGALAAVGLSHDNGPMIFSEPNRTSAIDDIRSVVIYIFIVAIFMCFFLILPGIRSEKFPTFLCITTSLLVTSIILLSLFGTTWHVADAPISAAYKAFSRDRIQGELSVKIGLQSVNITLRAHKYYILHATDGPMIMENSPPSSMTIMSSETSGSSLGSPKNTINTSLRDDKQLTSNVDGDDLENLSNSAAASSFINDQHHSNKPSIQQETSASKAATNLAEELLGERTSDGIAVDTELEVDEVFPSKKQASNSARLTRSSPTSGDSNNKNVRIKHEQLQKVRRRSTTTTNGPARSRRQPVQSPFENLDKRPPTSPVKYTIKRVSVDINYNERFYMIGPSQMRQEYHSALERGLPFPILTVMEYLSQDDAGFNWSRQYRAAGYYSSIMLWVSVCACILMFCLHCAAPKYGIYMMQILGCLLLFTDLIYFTLVPKGEQKLVIPFEGQSLSFRFGWSFWLTLVGGDGQWQSFQATPGQASSAAYKCQKLIDDSAGVSLLCGDHMIGHPAMDLRASGSIALLVGTVIVIIDYLFPNYIFTTILDVDFDANQNDYMKQKATKTTTSTTTTRSLNNNDNDHSLNGKTKNREPFKAVTDGTQQIRPSIPPFYNDSASKASSTGGTMNGDDDDDDEDDYEDDYFEEDATSTTASNSTGGTIRQQINDNHRQIFQRNARINSKIESTFKQRDSFIHKDHPTGLADLGDNHYVGKRSERANEGSSIVDIGKFDDDNKNMSTNESLRSRSHQSHGNNHHQQQPHRLRKTPTTKPRGDEEVPSPDEGLNVRL